MTKRKRKVLYIRCKNQLFTSGDAQVSEAETALVRHFQALHPQYRNKKKGGSKSHKFIFNVKN